MIRAFSGMVGYGSGPERAGCGSYCPALDDLSRELLAEDTTTQLQLQGLHGEELDATVASRVASLHAQRVALNRRSWNEHEAPRTPETVTVYEVRLDERDGQVHLYHPDAEQFVHDMFTNTARVAERAEREFGIKGLYNRKEHETFLQVEKAVLSGRAAGGMWAAYDASGTVRYVSQIERREGIVQTRWIDVGRIGGDLTPDEGVSLLRRIAGESQRCRFIANDGVVPYIIMGQEALRSNAVLDAASAVIVERLTNARTGEPRFGGVEVVDPRSASTDAVPSHYAPEAFSGREEMRKRTVASQLQACISPDVAAMGTLKVAEVLHERRNGYSLVELVDASVMPRIRRTAGSLRREERSIHNHSVAAFSLSIENIRKKPVRVVEEIRKRHAAMRQSFAALAVAGETGAAIGAAPLLVRALAAEQSRPIQAVEKSIKRHLKLRIKNREGRKKAKRETERVPTKPQPVKTERVEPLRTGKESKRKKKRRKVQRRETSVGRMHTVEKQRKERKKRKKIGVRKKAAAEIMMPMGMERRERKRRRRARRVIRRVEWALATKQLSKEEKKPWVALASQGSALRSWTEKKEPIAIMQFAWVLWILLMVHYERKKEKPKKIYIRHPLAALQGDALQNQEGTPWILFSIIYFLTAIREQALTNATSTTNTTKNQMNPPQQAFPRYAVIFACAS